MSLISYGQRPEGANGMEIVLRHPNAIVVRDPSSTKLQIQPVLKECPTCHQALRPAAGDALPSRSYGPDSFMNPNYFRMLRANAYLPTGSPRLQLPNPRWSHAPPVALEEVPDIEFPTPVEEIPRPPNPAEPRSSNEPRGPSRIRREAFSPNYFKSFFVEERVLGRGGKGVVMLVRHELDGCQLGHFACKRVPVGDDHAWLERVLIEVELLAKLSHPNLVSYRHVWLEHVHLNRFGPPVACAYILQQYCNSGDLHDYVLGPRPKEPTIEELKARMRRRSRGSPEEPTGRLVQRRLTIDEIFTLFRDITSGLAYLHAANYIHRDLKPNNCLLHREANVLSCLISDFGEMQEESAMRASTGSTGTVSYCAPEVLKCDSRGVYGNFTTKSDIFSLGMILYFMCFGRLPYLNSDVVEEEREDVDKLRSEIMSWKGFREEKHERPDLPPQLYQLLQRLLSIDPTLRPSAAEVLVTLHNEATISGGINGDNTTNSNTNGLGMGPQVFRPEVDPSSGDKVSGDVSSEAASWSLRHKESLMKSPYTDNPQDHPSEGLRRREAHSRARSVSARPGESLSTINTKNRLDSRNNAVQQGDYRMVLSSSSPSSPRFGSATVASPMTQESADAIHANHGALLLPGLPRSSSVRRLAASRQFELSYHIHSTIRFGLFLLKTLPLLFVCYPFAMKTTVSVPLLMVSILELWVEAQRDLHTYYPHTLWTSIILFLLHYSIVWGFRTKSQLCT